jgi:hypothetical protein
MAIDSTRDRELSLPEMLADPIVHALMASDGVAAVELKDLIYNASSRLGARKTTMIASPAWDHRKAHHDWKSGR